MNARIEIVPSLVERIKQTLGRPENAARHRNPRRHVRALNAAR